MRFLPKFAVLTFAGLLTVSLFGAEFNNRKSTCQHGEKQRHVELVYEVQGQATPCEVRYDKATEEPNNTQVLWSAKNQENFCEQKFSSFVEKLKGWGWNCGSQSKSAAH